MIDFAGEFAVIFFEQFMAIPRLHVAVITLDHAHAALD